MRDGATLWLPALALPSVRGQTMGGEHRLSSLHSPQLAGRGLPGDLDMHTQEIRKDIYY